MSPLRRSRPVSLYLEPLEDRTVPTTIVTGPTFDASNQTGPQSEVGVAINPLNQFNAVAVSNDISALSRLPAYYTLDGGYTWQTTFLNNATDGLGTGATRFDPNVAFDSDGNVYVIYSVNTTIGDRSRLIICKSTDGGVTYTQVSQAASHPTSSVIHTAMITTRADPGPAPDDVLVLWALVQGGGEFVQAALSLDGGATFPVTNTRINDAAPERTFLPWAAVDPWGYWHIVWEVNIAGTNPDGVMKHDVLDPDTLFGRPDTTVTTLMLTDFAQAWSRIPAQPDRGIFSVGTIDVDRGGGYFNGRIYLSYADRVSTTTNDTNIFVRYSDDWGFTWSDPLLINDDGGTTSQFFPRLAVDQVTGWVFMTWYDARQDPANRLVHVYGTASLYGGEVWLPNAQMTEEPSNESTTNPLRNANNYGEYTGLAAHHGVAYGAWTDARASHFAQFREEVYFGYFYLDDFGASPGRLTRPLFDLATFLAESRGPRSQSVPALLTSASIQREALAADATADWLWNPPAPQELAWAGVEWTAAAALPLPEAWLALAGLDWHGLGWLRR